MRVLAEGGRNDLEAGRQECPPRLRTGILKVRARM